MVQREVAERVAAAPGDMSLPVGLRASTTRRPGSRSGCRATRSSPRPRSSPPCSCSSRTRADDRLDAAAEAHLWRVVQAGFRERRKMLHNVLTRQLPIDGGARGRGARRPVASTATAAPRRVAVGEWIALAEALGPIPDALTRPRDRRPRPPARARRPPRAGEGQPDARRPRHAGRRLPRPAQRHGPARTSPTGCPVGGCHRATADTPPRRRLRPRARRRTTSSCARSRPHAGPPGPPGAGTSRRRRSPPASTSGSRSRPASPAGRRTRPRPRTRRSRRGAWTLDRRGAPRARRGARLRRPVLPGRRARRSSRAAGSASRRSPWLRDARRGRTTARASCS